MQEAQVTTELMVQKTLADRDEAGHKGTFGTSLIIAGSDEMPGSVALCAIGAIRAGTGRLFIATSEAVIPQVVSHVPEATFISDGLAKIAAGYRPEKISSASIGPGLTNRKLVQRALNQLLQWEIPILIDAGALEKRASWNAKGPVIVTPHPGEFSRMTGYSIEEINKNRIDYSHQFAKEENVILVLKGKDTVIAFPNGKLFLNPTGNTGLAKGGSGDVLTGILTSFLTTHEKVEDAVVNAVYVHGLCADIWAEKYSEATMTASDFAKLIPIAMKRIETAITLEIESKNE